MFPERLGKRIDQAAHLLWLSKATIKMIGSLLIETDKPTYIEKVTVLAFDDMIPYTPNRFSQPIDTRLFEAGRPGIIPKEVMEKICAA
jgi:hypothetical protein